MTRDNLIVPILEGEEEAAAAASSGGATTVANTTVSPAGAPIGESEA